MSRRKSSPRSRPDVRKGGPTVTTEPLISPSDLPISVSHSAKGSRTQCRPTGDTRSPSVRARAAPRKEEKKALFFASGLLTALPSFFPYTCAWSKKKGLYNPSLKIFFWCGEHAKNFKKSSNLFFFLFNLIFKDTGRLEVWHHPAEPDSEPG